jgi:hypothetical protein
MVVTALVVWVRMCSVMGEYSEGEGKEGNNDGNSNE